MKKKVIITVIVLLLLITGFAAWKFMSPAVSTSAGEFFYIKTGASCIDVRQDLVRKKYISSEKWFDWASRILRFNTVKPGRYKLKKGMSLFELVRLLRTGNQTQVSLVITKLRTREDLARKVGNLFECDSLDMIHFLDDPDSLISYGLDSNTVMAAVMPFTYTINWNTTPGKIFRQFNTAWQNFWTAQRKQKADSLHLSPVQVSTLASIVEEETLRKDDKYNIASTYLNRLRIGMPLQADPTVKFALKDFSIKRVTGTHLRIVSPFNTYINGGLPPGPICTPSVETLDAVLDSPKTDYLYFVASSSFDGSSVFTTNLKDHGKYARAYQEALTKRMDSVKKAKSQ